MPPLVLYLNAWAFEWHAAPILDANDFPKWRLFSFRYFSLVETNKKIEIYSFLFPASPLLLSLPSALWVTL